MRISIDATPAVREILRDELWNELQSQLPREEFCTENKDDSEGSEKGLWEDIFLAIMTKMAAEITGKILTAFTKKHKVKITVWEPDGRKIEVSYLGDDYKELEKFLEQCVK